MGLWWADSSWKHPSRMLFGLPLLSSSPCAPWVHRPASVTQPQVYLHVTTVRGWLAAIAPFRATTTDLFLSLCSLQSYYRTTACETAKRLHLSRGALAARRRWHCFAGRDAEATARWPAPQEALTQWKRRLAGLSRVVNAPGVCVCVSLPPSTAPATWRQRWRAPPGPWRPPA